MSGYAHYKNSKISMNNWEPVPLNLFEVIITPPPTVDKWDYVLEQITKIEGMATDQTPPAGIEQIYKGAKRRFSNNFPDATTVDLTVGFEVNVDDELSMIPYRGLRNWCDLVWNPLNATMKTKKNYIGGPINIFLYNREDEVIRQWIFPVVWPTSSLPAIGLDYTQGSGKYELSMNFAADYYEDMAY